MRFGTSLPLVQQMPATPAWQAGDDVAVLVAVAKHADELGYDWLPCSDHVVVPERAVPNMGASWYDPAPTLAFVAGQTRRICLLTHVLVLPYHDPFEVAKQYATLDRLSGGRLIFGVGTGHLRSEFRALGADFDRRGAVTDERIALIKTLWEEGKVTTAQGDLHLSPRPAQQPRPPIWVGGNSRRAARRAVELGDGWVPWQVTLDDVRDRLDYVRRLPAFAHRPFEVTLPVGPVDITRGAIHGDRSTFTGSVEQVIDDLQAFDQAGVSGLTVNFASSSLDEHLDRMEQFARELIPAFS